MYKRDAIYYDSLNASLQTADIEYYHQVVLDEARNICEVACGTGRILLFLGREQANLHGIDISEEMLCIAEEKAKRLGRQVKWICADMCALGAIGNFDVIICGYNAVQHILTDERMGRFFQGIYSNLDRQGRVYLDLFQPDDRYLFQGGNRRFLAQLEEPEGVIQVVETTRYNLNSKINHIKYQYYRGDQIVLEENYQMKQYDAETMDKLVTENGFEIIEKFGDYDCSPFTGQSPKQLYILGKKKMNDE